MIWIYVKLITFSRLIFRLSQQMKRIKTIAIIPLLFVASSCLFGQDATTETVKKPSILRFLATGAFEFGGDEVAKVYFTNGKSQSVNAGQGVALGLGVQLSLTQSEKFLLRGTVGYKYVTTQANNANIRLTRVPIHLTTSLMATDKIRLSAGLAMHQSINFKTDNLGTDLKIKNASGPIFEIAYSGFGLIYTSMKYVDQYKTSYSANSIGISISGTFPRRKQ